jgi:hypothetical protein
MFFRTATSLNNPQRQATRIVEQAMLNLLMLVTVALALPLTGRAESINDASTPPSRIGRIDVVEGDVSFFADREEGWRKARLNFPVTSKNSIWTNGPARAEIRFGASAVRLDADTMLDFVAVDDQGTDLFLQRGSVYLRIREYGSSPTRSERSERSDRENSPDDYRDQFRIETDSGTWIFEKTGRYRIDASPERGETHISVFAGQARFDNGSANLKVEAGKGLLVRGSTGATSFSFDRAAESAFDRWAAGRDQRWDDSHQRVAAERIVSPYMTGYEDLDANGDWIDEPEYGRVWTPRVVVAGWVPYRYGSWAYVRPWGWTWIDDAPWGFAPFHYGRWVQIRTRWYWSPGRFHHRPVYAPALVTWYGDGPSGSTSISIGIGGNIGWCPLAPREHYVPTYTTNLTYVRRINNVTNNITIINPPTRYVNQGAGGTVVRNHVVVGGEPVWRQPNIQIGSRIQKPLRDPSGPAVDPNLPPRWVPVPPPQPPSLPTAPNTPNPPSYPGAPRGTVVRGESPQLPQTPASPNVRRPTWIGGEIARPQGGMPAPQVTGQPAVPPSPQSPATPATPLPSYPSEPIAPAAPLAPTARPKPAAPTPRPIPMQTQTGEIGTAAPNAGQPPALMDGPTYNRENGRRERVERAERGERAERIERIERGSANASPAVEPRPNPPPQRLIQQRQPDGGAPRAEPRAEAPRVSGANAGATAGAANVKTKEGRDEKAAERNERQERGERAPKTAPQ